LGERALVRGDRVSDRRTDETHVPEARHDPDFADDLDPDVAEPSTVEAPAPGLDERALQILAFERRWWKHAGSKEQSIRDTFGLSATRYYQLLNGLLDDPEALKHDPVLVGRLRRLRASRARRS
jgi:hypothetical protein